MYQRETEGLVKGRQRIALYPSPGFQLGPVYAAAVFDFDLVMKREAVPADAPSGAVACIVTPKDVAQCL